MRSSIMRSFAVTDRAMTSFVAAKRATINSMVASPLVASLLALGPARADRRFRMRVTVSRSRARFNEADHRRQGRRVPAKRRIAMRWSGPGARGRKAASQTTSRRANPLADRMKGPRAAPVANLMAFSSTVPERANRGASIRRARNLTVQSLTAQSLAEQSRMVRSVPIQSPGALARHRSDRSRTGGTARRAIAIIHRTAASKVTSMAVHGPRGPGRADMRMILSENRFALFGIMR